jgi:two-component system response regulator LytT
MDWSIILACPKALYQKCRTIKGRKLNMRVAICDDETQSIAKLKTVLKNYKEKHQVSLQVFVFNNPNDLLDQLDRDENFIELILLDIKMGNANGIETAKRVHDINSDILIIFISGFDSFIQTGYEVNAFGTF